MLEDSCRFLWSPHSCTDETTQQVQVACLSHCLFDESFLKWSETLSLIITVICTSESFFFRLFKHQIGFLQYSILSYIPLIFIWRSSKCWVIESICKSTSLRLLPSHFPELASMIYIKCSLPLYLVYTALSKNPAWRSQVPPQDIASRLYFLPCPLTIEKIAVGVMHTGIGVSVHLSVEMGDLHYCSLQCDLSSPGRRKGLWKFTTKYDFVIDGISSSSDRYSWQWECISFRGMNHISLLLSSGMTLLCASVLCLHPSSTQD